MRRFRHRLVTAYAESIEPMLFRLRERGRLAAYGLQSGVVLPHAHLALEGGMGCEAHCLHWIDRYDRYYRRFAHLSTEGRNSLNGRGHMAILNLKTYGGFSKYLAQQKRDAGNFYRSAVQARRRGFVVRTFEPQAHLWDILAIRRSKRRRSFGIVLDAFLLTEDVLRTEIEREVATQPMQCLHHWARWWGVFDDFFQDDGSMGRLVGYAVVHRIGNVARYAEFMGHGSFLRQGVMMALHNEIVAWLLESRDALTQRIHYLSYGAVEQGNDGLAFWKRKAQFRPHLLEFCPAGLEADSPGAHCEMENTQT